MGLSRPQPEAKSGQGPRDASSGQAARDAAVQAVIAVASNGKSIGAALDAARRQSALDSRDVGFATHLARTTLRRYHSLLAVVDAFMPRGRPTNAGPLNAIFATAAAQLILLKLPPHAVINIAVEQTQAHRRSRNFKGLVNAVLRKIADTGTDVFAAIDAAETDIPRWLLTRWTDHYGAEAARSIARACLEPAHLDITPKSPGGEHALRLDGLLLSTGTIRCATGVRIDEMPGFADGDWWVQDAAAALPAQLLGATVGEHILDLCAAPGGKTMQLAAEGARVTAVDLDDTRLTRIRDNLDRVGLSAELIAADATAYAPTEPVDRILLDVPCSATGTIRRHPDILHSKRPGDITANRDTQAALLDHAIAILKPGGTLVYCSCSLEPEEGQDQIAAALARHPHVRRLPVVANEFGIPGSWITSDGDLRTRPDFDVPVSSPANDQPSESKGLDGFFATRLTKT